MWFDEEINLVIETDPFVNVSGATSFSQIDNITAHITEQPIIISLSENYAPVQSVNGQIGFVVITKESLGITGGLVTSGDLSNYVTKINGEFSNRPNVNGTGILLSGELGNLPDTVVYTTGNQSIDGVKTFNSNITIFGTNDVGNIKIVEDYLGGEIGILSHLDEVIAIKMGDGTYQYGGGNFGEAPLSILNGVANFTNRPNVNGTGVLLNGEAITELPSNLVNTDQDQFISGQKIFLIQPNKSFWIDSENLDSSHGWLYLDQDYSSIGYHNNGISFNDSDIQVYGVTNFNDIAQFIGNGKILFVGNEDYGTQLDGNKSGIKLSTFQNPTDITIRTDFVGGNYDDIISIHHSYYTAQLFGESINAATELGDQIVIYQTGSLYGIPNSKGPYLRLGTHNIISEKSDSKLGIGTLFPQEKVHISGGNLRVEGDVLANNLYTKDNPSGFITGIDLSNYATVSNLQLTGKNLNDKINSLSGVAVLIYGDQIINGTKRFNENVYIKNLFVTGTETIISTTNFNVQSPYLILNLTGGAVDGGIFFVTGSGLTGINDYGPIIGFDHSKNFKFGVARRSDDLSTLNDIAAIQDITNYSGFVDNKYYPKNNPSGFITGIDLSPYVTKSNGQFDDRPTVNGTGILLSGEAAQLPDTIVYTTGNNVISGDNTFYGDQYIFSGADIIVSGGTFNLDIRPVVNGTGVLLSGEAAQLPETIVYTTNDQSITGLKTFRSGIRIGEYGQTSTPTIQTFDGANGEYSTFYLQDAQLYINSINRTLYYDFSKYPTGTTQTIAVIKDIENYTGFATITNLATTGSTLDTKINSLSGTLTSDYATIINLATTGSTLNTKINNLSGYVTGITGTFGTSVNALNTYAVLTTGNQTISGQKTFATGIDILSIGTGIRIIYGTGTNSGEFGILDWSNGQFKINTLGVGSGVTRTVAVGTASSFGSVGVGLYVNTPSNQVSLNASQNSVRVSSSNVEIYARNAAGSATSLHLSAGGDAVRVNKLIASSGADIYFSGNTSIGNLISGFWNNTGIAYTGIYYNINLFTGASGLIPNTTNTLFNTAVNNTGVFNINSKGQVLVQQLAGSTIYDNTFEIKRGSTSFFTVRDDGVVNIPVGNGLAVAGSPNAAIRNGVITVGNGGYFGIGNTSDAYNYPNEHTVRLYRGGDFILDLRNATYPASGHQFRVFNITGTNSGEYGIFGWQVTGIVTGTGVGGIAVTGNAPNALVIGTQATQSGTLRDLIITGSDIYLNPSGRLIINSLNPTGRNLPALSINNLWNDSTRLFTGVLIDITDSGSSLNSHYLNIRNNGTNVFTVRRSSASLFTDLLSNTYGFRFGTNAGTIGFTLRPQFDLAGFSTNTSLVWGSDVANLNYDLILARDAANTLAQRNGTNAQQFRVYNLTGTNTGEFGLVGWQNNNFIVGAQRTQNGTLRDLTLTGANVNIASSGIIISNPTVPTSTGSAGTRGQISWDNDFIYVCVSGNSWKRSALTTW